MTAWAHSANTNGSRQTLRDHLMATATLAKGFAAAFGAGQAGWAVGLLHDAGKVSASWQERLMCLEAGVPAPRVDHKTFGAQLCSDFSWRHGCLAIAGHHGGIPDHDQRPVDAPDEELSRIFLALVPEATQLPPVSELMPSSWSHEVPVAEFGIRMLHSCLVDADYLDTAAHFAGQPVELSKPTDMEELFNRLVSARSDFLQGRNSGPIDRHREALFQVCLARAEDDPGVYRLSGPTGSGKTISAAAFALRHAQLHGKRRVVVAVPFTTITEQNAAVYRSLLGEDVVLEHHSAVEPERLAGRGVENWDAPFVVTTTVQLFESLFSNRPSKTRKLHRLANSVIVLDEVQAIPDHLLLPILCALRILVDHFGVTVLMASATQPSWEQLKPWRDAELEPREIVPDPTGLFQALRRVRYEWVDDLTLDQVVERATSTNASLTVVNTTANARTLAKELQQRASDEVAHLSTRMCRVHRTAVLEDVRRRLRDGEGIHLVSTQLIEAGVDVDFPLVLRQEAPAPSLIQAAGRANREGRNSLGSVVVFSSPELATIRDHVTAVGLTRLHFRQNPNRLDEPAAVAAYYSQLYQASATNSASRRIQQSRAALAFEDVAAQFRMIEDCSVSVVVDWQGLVHGTLLSQLSERQRSGRDVLPMSILRQLQPFTVALPKRFADQAEVRALMEEPVPGVFLWKGAYDMTVGIGDDVALSYVF